MDINFWAVAVAVVAFQVLGMAWWSPLLFGNAWMRALGLTKNDIENTEQNMGLTYATSFVMTVLSALGLAVVFALAGVQSFGLGVLAGLGCWVCFSLAYSLKTRMFDNSPWTIFFITDGYELAGYLIMGAIIGGWV